MATTTTYNFTTAGNYTASDSGTVEVTGGKGQLKDQVPSDELFYAGFDDASLDGTRGGGTLTATNSGATVAGGYAEVNGTTEYFEWPAAGNFDHTSSWTLRLAYTPNYSSPPPANMYFFDYNNAVNNDRIDISHRSDNRIFVEVYNNAGTRTVYYATSTTVAAGTEYILEFTFDHENNLTEFFQDGVYRNGAANSDWNHDAVTTETMRIGNSSSNGDFKINWLTIFNTVKNTDTHTVPDPPVLTPYETATNPSLTTVTAIYGNPASFVATSTEPGSDSLSYTVLVSGVEQYWDGSAWSTSSGYAQSNTEAEVNDNISLVDTGNNPVTFRVYFDSADGSTTPDIDVLQVSYDASDTSATEPTSVYLEGWLYDFNGPQSGVTIEVRPAEGFINGETFITHSWQTFDVSASDGYFAGRIWESATVTKEWEFRINGKKFRVTIPDQAVVAWSDLTLTVVENT